MLCLTIGTRNSYTSTQEIRIGTDVSIRVTRAHDGIARIAIEAPKSVRILRFDEHGNQLTGRAKGASNER